MIELQVAISHLKETISIENVLLAKLEAEQEKIKKPEVPSFPVRFIAVKDCVFNSNFVIGLDRPSVWTDDLPEGYKGRAMFTKDDIRQIIEGLQTLLGER